MSLSDHLRYLRALAGGPDTDTVAQVLGMETPAEVNQAEVRYRPVPDEALIAALADYYGRSAEEFHWHNARSRRDLTFYVVRQMKANEPVALTLRGGEVLRGAVEWWDLGSVGVRQENGRIVVVQRHAVVDWPGVEDGR